MDGWLDGRMCSAVSCTQPLNLLQLSPPVGTRAIPASGLLTLSFSLPFAEKID